MPDLKNSERSSDRQDTAELGPLGPPLIVEACGRTDRGRMRENNEDHFVVAELAKILRVDQTSLPGPDEKASANRAHLFLVADGMGGYAGGEVASRIVASTVEEWLLDSLKWFLQTRGAERRYAIDWLGANEQTAYHPVPGASAGVELQSRTPECF